jgi:curli production assembly/transport component CsgG
MNRLIFKLLSGLLVTVFLISCSSAFKPISSDKASTDYHSGISDLLRSLPPPPQPIIVAVYKFRDQTGQYKGSDTLMQYSTAVTQGATSMLTRALMEAGNGKWFTVVEREGLTDLMNERKIIQQTREMYASDKKNELPIPNLPPLLYAPILLEGGIISYESNLLTGGMGGYYLGIGGSGEFRRDTVTSMLRAVSVKNGGILTQVDAKKTILSLELDSGLFRYIAFKRLLQIESGISSNEPPQMAVMESIEACVYAMIVEGFISNTWSLKNKKLVKPLVEEYLKQRDSQMVAEFDAEGRIVNVTPKKTK